MIEYVQVSRLKLLQKNPRRIDKPQFEKLCKSLKYDPDFLICRPILVKRHQGELIVYAGNQRVMAAKKLGWKTIPCEISDNISDEQMQSRIIKDNAHYGQWDFDLLADNFDIDMLLDCGISENLLIGNHPEKDILEKEKIEELGITEPGTEVADKKKKTCPECGHEF